MRLITSVNILTISNGWMTEMIYLKAYFPPNIPYIHLQLVKTYINDNINNTSYYSTY